MRSQVNSRAVKSAYLTTCKDPISDLTSAGLYNPSTPSIKASLQTTTSKRFEEVVKMPLTGSPPHTAVLQMLVGLAKCAR